MIKQSIIFLFVLLFSTVVLADLKPKRRATYFVEGGEQVEIEWSIVDNAVYYQVELYQFEKGIFKRFPDAVSNKITIDFPMLGHYAIRIRSCNQKGCSKWVDARSPKIGIIDGKKEGWWIYHYED